MRMELEPFERTDSQGRWPKQDDLVTEISWRMPFDTELRTRLHRWPVWGELLLGLENS